MRWMTSILLLLTEGVVLSNAQDAAIKREGSDDDRGTIAWHVRQAKANGRSHVDLPAAIGVSAHVGSLDEALAHYTVVVARPVASTVRMPDKYGIVTWWRLAILDRLNVRPLSDFEPDQIPTELLPLAADEIVITQHGGTIQVDDVTVTLKDKNYPLLSSQHTYLLFLKLDPSGKVGWVQLGGDGIFEITADRQIAPLTPRTTRFRDDVHLLTSGSLDRLQTEIKQRSSQ